MAMMWNDVLVEDSSISMDKIGNRGKCQATVLKYGEFLQKDLSRDKLPRCVGI